MKEIEVTLSIRQIQQMLHAIDGNPHDPYRNHYVTGGRSEVWDDLLKKNLAHIDNKPLLGGVFYRVSELGLVLLRAISDSIKEYHDRRR